MANQPRSDRVKAIRRLAAYPRVSDLVRFVVRNTPTPRQRNTRVWYTVEEDFAFGVETEFLLARRRPRLSGRNDHEQTLWDFAEELKDMHNRELRGRNPTTEMINLVPQMTGEGE